MMPPFVGAVSRAYGRPLTPAGVEALGARYGEWQGLWALYIRASEFAGSCSSRPIRPARA